MDSQPKLTRAFFITFTFLMAVGAHYFQHNQGGSGLELAQNNIVWIFISILIGLGLWQITAQQKIIYSRFTIIFLVALLLFVIPISYPNNELADQSYTRLIGLVAGFLFFVSLQQFQFNRVQIQRLLLLIVLAGFIQSCYSLMQDYLLTAGNIFGYDIGYGRPYGIFQQPNVLASFMATTLILSGYLLQKIDDKRLQVFLLLTALINMWVITITMSRTGYLGTILALLFLLPWAWQSNKKKLTAFVASISLGLVAAVLCSIMLKGDVLAARNLDNLKEGGARVDIYQHTWQMIKQKPMLGYGYGGFEKNYLLTQAERVKNKELSPSGQSQLTHPHNDTLYWAVEGGIVPILAILVLVFAFIGLLRKFKLPYACALLALVIPISLHTQTEYPLYHSTLHWLVLLALVFYIVNESQVTEEKTFTLSFALRVSAFFIPLITTFFMLTNLYTISKITQYERTKTPNVEILLDIINPLVFENRFNFHLSYFRLSAAIKRNKIDEIKKLIEETERIVESKPKPYFYALLYLAYSNSKQEEKAQQVLNYARYLYPLDAQLANIDKPMETVKSPKSNSAPPAKEIQ